MHGRKCIEHVGSTQSSPWDIQRIPLGNFLRDFPRNYSFKGKTRPALMIDRRVIACQFCLYVWVPCARTRGPHFQGKSGATADCQSPAHRWALLTQDAKKAHTHTYRWGITLECPQISLFNKPGALILGGGAVKKCQSTDFSRPWIKRRTCQIHVGILGTQPSKNANKQTNINKKKRELWTSKRTIVTGALLHFLRGSVCHKKGLFSPPPCPTSL